MIKDYETKLHDVQSENTQLSEQNCLLQEDSRRSADELKKIQSSFNGTHDMPTTRRELEDRIKTLSEQLTQCTSDHASLFDAKEQLDHQFRFVTEKNSHHFHLKKINKLLKQTYHILGRFKTIMKQKKKKKCVSLKT